MTHEEFMANMEMGYGKYNNYMKVKLYEYIIEKYNESDLKYLERLVIENFSTKWKTPPDIAIIKEITDKDNKENMYDPHKIGKGNNQYLKMLENKKLKVISNAKDID